ncbi:ATP-binding protein [Amygdalobacter indicium]|uniref:sensor histidine kinase n=1 Tax=Amygdalobacter indicium TaxID=3029272 RepID=UPI00279D4F09|nr:ATP-binding protein [Amygdalobacter indicium]WEG34077.1 ATP-binding protein [Amygdalobacter indicium]
MKQKINLRLIGIAILAIAATVIAMISVYYRLLQVQVKKDLRLNAQLLQSSDLFTDPEHVERCNELKDLCQSLRITWIGTDGRVLFDNDFAAARLGNHADRQEVKAACRTGEGQAVRYSSTLNKDTFYYALRLADGTILRLAAEYESIGRIIISVIPIIALILLLILLVCIALSHMLTTQLIKPIEAMARNITDKDFQAPYKELAPFSDIIRTQHMEILAAAKDRQDFTANVSHELKTPLTAISGYAELLAANMVAPEQKMHFYHEIQKCAARLLRLINDIIRLAALDRSERESLFNEVDLAEIVEESLNTLQLNAEQHKIKLNLQLEKCIVHGNREMLKELVDNLVVNAIFYNSPGGYVLIKVGTDKGRQKLLVKDNGIGIPATEQGKIFQRFYRVDKSRSKATGGTGLGLAIVKHIVELHSAEIILDSTPGVGTSFTIVFSC